MLEYIRPPNDCQSYIKQNKEVWFKLDACADMIIPREQTAKISKAHIQ